MLFSTLAFVLLLNIDLKNALGKYFWFCSRLKVINSPFAAQKEKEIVLQPSEDFLPLV
jgi:hypothetical protein